MAIIGFNLNSPAQDNSEIKLGVLMPLTGGFGDLGNKIRKGAELAVDEINASGGINGQKVSLVVEDEQCDPKVGLSALTKLVEVDNLKLIVGPLCSGVVLSVAPYTNEKKIILMQASQVPKVPFGGEYVFRPISGAQIMAPNEARIVFTDFNIRKVAFLAVNSDLGKAYTEYFQRTFEALGGIIVSSEKFNASDTDFRVQINKIASKQIDAILLVGNPNEMGLAAKQIREAGVLSKILLPPTAESPALLTAAAGAMDGAIYVYGFNPNLSSAEQTNFITKYKEKYSEDISWHAAIGYDTVNIYAKLIKDCGSAIDVNCIKEKLPLIHYSGAQGEINFSPNGDANIPIVLKTIEAGKFVIYQKN